MPDAHGPTIQRLGDRVAIEELLLRYARAVDSGDWDLLDTVFTADAVVDLSAPGGPKGSRDEVKTWLAATLPAWPGRQHLLGLVSVEFAGDEATALASFTDTLSPSRDMTSADVPGLLRGGGTYRHRLRRTEDGWRSHAMTIDQQWRTING